VIGWRPYLLTVLAAVVLAVVALDVAAAFHAAHPEGAGIARALHTVSDAVAWISDLGVLDWLLAGAAAVLRSGPGRRVVHDAGPDDNRKSSTVGSEHARRVRRQATLEHELGLRVC
jgi:hypothetical protein